METISSDQSLKLENQLCFPLYASARKVVNLYTPYFKELGLTYTQYIVFMVLWDCDTITVGELCRKLYLDNGTMTPLLKRMEKDGYVERTRSPEDERVVHVTLTKQGREMKRKLAEVPRKVGGCISLTPEEALQLYGLLYKLLDNMDNRS